MKNNYFQFWVAILFTPSIFLFQNSFSQTISSGFYNWGTMSIAVDKASGKITGCYENYKDLDETTQQFKYNCVFYFSGNFTEGTKTFSIMTSLADGRDTISGEIRIESEKKIRFHLNRDRKDCGQIEKFTETPTPVFESMEKKDWISIVVVRADKAYFYTSNNETAKSRRYLVKGDCIKILEQKGDWLKAEFTRGETMNLVWMKKSDVF